MITSLRSLTSERIRQREARIRQLEQDRDAREAAIIRGVPRLGEIKAIQSTIGLDLARLMLHVPTAFGKSFDELQAWSLQLSAERDRLLREYNINAGELEIHWDCPDCKNIGWLPPEEAGPDTVHPSRKCHCLVQQEIEDLYRVSGLTGPLRQQTFQRFDMTVYPHNDQPYMTRVVEHCKSYARRMASGSEHESLLLTGQVGRGKTFLASAIANAAVDAKRPVVYFTFSEFLDLIRLHKFGNEDEYRNGSQRLLESDLIVLDDLGAEKVTEFVGQELFNLINHRMNRQLPMIISTNLTPADVDAVYGQRIASRLLYGFTVIELKGEDIRAVLKRQA